MWPSRESASRLILALISGLLCAVAAARCVVELEPGARGLRHAVTAAVAAGAVGFLAPLLGRARRVPVREVVSVAVVGLAVWAWTPDLAPLYVPLLVAPPIATAAHTLSRGIS